MNPAVIRPPLLSDLLEYLDRTAKGCGAQQTGEDAHENPADRSGGTCYGCWAAELADRLRSDEAAAARDELLLREEPHGLCVECGMESYKRSGQVMEAHSGPVDYCSGSGRTTRSP